MTNLRSMQKPALVALALLSISVASCRKADDQQEQQPVENNAPAPTEPTPAPVAPPKPVEAPKFKVAKPKPAPELSADQQMIDDADATGMTARVGRNAESGDTPAPDNEQN